MLFGKDTGWLPATASTRLVLGVTLALLCAPVLIDLAVSGPTGPFTYVCADTFYYLTVARNIARHGLASFDGQHLTNGFHPVWQFMMGALYFLLEQLGASSHAIVLAVLGSLALLAGGVVLLGRSFSERGALSPLFALLPVGVYGLLLSPFWLTRLNKIAAESVEGPFPVYGTWWSYSNGMESGAVLFALGLCALAHRAWHRQPSRRRALYFGLSAALFVLSRLDHVLVCLPVVAAFCVTALQQRGRWRDALVALLGFGIPVGIDIAVNIIVFGAAVPVSGAAKLTFPFVTPVHIQSWLDTLHDWPRYGLFVLQREASLLLPMAFALVYLALTLRLAPLGSTLLVQYRERTRDFERFLVPIAVGVLLFGAHEILFLNDGPGSWHLPVSTTFVSLVMIALVSRARRALGPRAVVATLGLITCLTVAFFVTLRQPTYHGDFATFYLHDAPLLRRAFGAKPPRIVEFDDGIVNYSLDIPAMSNRLAIDPEGLDALHGGQLYSLAYERGFNCLSSLAYFPHRLRGNSSPEAAQDLAKTMYLEDLSAFSFEVAYLSVSNSMSIVCGHKR